MATIGRTQGMDAKQAGPGAGLHVAIIMDGNGRWAQARGRPRAAGHIAGARATRRVVEAARELDVAVLTLYAFSADNWRRPDGEVAGLMRLFRRYLLSETERCRANGIRMSIVGRRDRLGLELRHAIEAAERATDDCQAMTLRIALDYSARDAILRAAALAGGAEPSRAQFSGHLARACHDPVAVPDVDLLIRTGGEQRLSDFLLWESAYAELFFSPTMWPDFTEADLVETVTRFACRERRFGGIGAARSA